MDFRRLLRRSGRQVSSPLIDFWQIARGAQDPSVPNLPLETPADTGASLSLGLTLDSATLAAAIANGVAATLAKTLDDATLAAQAAVGVSLRVGITLDAAILTGTASTAAVRDANLVVTLDDTTLSAGSTVADTVVVEIPPRRPGGLRRAAVREPPVFIAPVYEPERPERRGRVAVRLEDAALRAGVGVGRVATVAANLEPARCRGGADVRVRSRMVISLDDARPVAGATVDWRHAIDDDEEILRLLWAA